MVRRTSISLGVAMLAVGLAATSAGADRGNAEPSVRARAIAIVSTGLTDSPRADYESDRQVRCVARGVVERFGIERLEELGLDLDARQGPRLYVPGLTDRERDKVAAAYDACIDAEREYVAGLVDEGLSEAEARCVFASYDASGIPKIHLTEAPHGESQVDTEPARAHLDDFLNVAKLTCIDWL